MKRNYFFALLLLVGCSVENQMTRIMKKSENHEIVSNKLHGLGDEKYAVLASKNPKVIGKVVPPNSENLNEVSKNEEVTKTVIENPVNVDKVINDDKNKNKIEAKADEINTKKVEENWPRKLSRNISQNSFEYALQEEFKSYRSNICGCSSFSKVVGERDYIPNNVRGYLSSSIDNTLCYEIKDVGAYALFFYIFTNEEKENFGKEFIIVPTSFLDVKGFNLTTSPAGKYFLNNFIFQSSCSAVFQSELSAEFAIPVAELKAGLEADLKGESQITCIGGYFSSTLENLLQNGDDAEMTYLYFHLWNFYSDYYKKHSNSKLWYLSSFPGISIANDFSSEKLFDLAFDASLGLGKKINGSVNFNYSGAQFFSGKKWKTLIDKEFVDKRKNEIFKEFDAPSSIASYLNRLKPKNDLNNLPPLLEGIEYKIELEFVGIPEGMSSNLSNWEILEIDELFSNYKIDIERESTTKSTPFSEVTRFIITGTPLNELFDSNTRSLDVEFKLRYKLGINSENIEFNVDNINIRVHEFPYIDFNFVNAGMKGNANTWSGRLNFRTTEHKIDKNGTVNGNHIFSIEGAENDFRDLKCNLSQGQQGVIKVELEATPIHTLSENTQLKKGTLEVELMLENRKRQILKRKCEFWIPVRIK